MKESENIFGCFVSSHASLRRSGDKTEHILKDKGELFRNYVWGQSGFCKTLKRLRHENYGEDLKLILFQFYINPVPYLLANLSKIENFRRKEQAIGIPIIVTDKNFFDEPEEARWFFLKNSILEKLDLLVIVVDQKKLDTDITLLKEHTRNILFQSPE